MTTMTKERLLTIKQWRETYGPGSNVVLPAEEAEELARIALASLEAKPIGAFHIAEQQVDGTSDYLKDGEWPIDNGIIEVYAAPPATVSVPDEIYAELYQLREEVKGPDGFNTWRDAATAEKVLRLSIERDALRYRFLRDKDAFGDENEPGLASWGDLAEMEYNEFDANVDARMNNSDIPRHSITQAQMIENDVAASEKKAPNERYKQISYIDYLGAMSAFHSDKWHKMGSITGYMHGWNACRAAMLQSGNFRENKNSSTNNFREIAETSTNYPVIPSEVLSAIREVAKIRADFDDFDGDRRGIGDCLDEAEQELIVTINKYASQLAAEPIAPNDVREQTAIPQVPVTPDGWISCSERMPDDNQHVIILCDGAFVLYAQYRDGEFFDIVRNGDEFFETQSRNVTDWMQLPEPPL